jgi:mycothiol synthase
VIIRPAGPADADDVAAVCAAALQLDSGAGELPAILHGAAGDRIAVVAEAAGQVVGAGFGSTRRLAAGPICGYADLIAVAPSAAGQGAGRMLLATIEDWLARRGAVEVRLAGHPPAYVWPGVDVGYTAMTCLASRTGYERTGEAVNLAVDLAAASLDSRAGEARLTAGGITVRRAGPAEAAPVTEWLRAGPWGDSSWPAEAAAALARDPAGCHLACRGGDYVGFACYGCNRPDWFGPMGTLDSERRNGVGAVLLLRCLADMKAAGMPVAQIAWAGPVHFYARTVAARIDRVFWQYRKAL